MAGPDLDEWVPRPTIRVTHQAVSRTAPERLWGAADALRLGDTRVLGRLIRWRIPGTPPDTSFHELFRNPPFLVLAEDELSLLSGLVGRIWTLRRDYPRLEEPDAFRAWQRAGTVRVLFAHWVAPHTADGSVLHSETRVQAFGTRGRLGLASLRPLIRSTHHLVGTDALATAARTAEASDPIAEA